MPRVERLELGGYAVRTRLAHDVQGRRDLNPRPSVLETDALPTELLPSVDRLGEATNDLFVASILDDSTIVESYES
jgi:hypothetical protein